jgi:hypothetical protein
MGGDGLRTEKCYYNLIETERIGATPGSSIVPNVTSLDHVYGQFGDVGRQVRDPLQVF